MANSFNAFLSARTRALILAGALALGAPVSAQQSAETERALDSLTAVVSALQAQVEGLSVAVNGAAAQPAAQARAGGTYMNVGFVGLTDFGWSTEPDVESLQVGDHDPRVRGWTLPNGELTLDGAVDPYFQAATSIVYKLDGDGETGVELEEMYFLTTSLPGNLQLKGGQFFAEFGRQNTLHPHSWGFADQPLVLNRMFGAEGLRSQGFRLSWLLPTSFYTEASLGVFNSGGETASSFRSEESPEIHGGEAVERGVHDARDLLYVPRLSTSIELNDTQTLLFGASAALGPNNSGTGSDTRIFGGDLYWKWKSARAMQGFPFVSFQTEGIWRRYEAGRRSAAESPFLPILPAETLSDAGMYAQLLWGIKPLLVAGLRAEVVDGQGGAFESALRADRQRVSPNLTWYPSEFSKIRVQYNYDLRPDIGVDHSFWMQIEFLLGAHAAHKF